MTKFAWKPIAVGYLVSLLSIAGASCYALFSPKQAEITVRNLRGQTVEIRLETSTLKFNRRLEPDEIWHISVAAGEKQWWNLRTNWKNSDEALESRTYDYARCDNNIDVSSLGSLTLPQECD